MATTSLAVALKFIANNNVSPEIKKITGDLGKMAACAVAAKVSFDAFKSIGKYMLDAARGASDFNKELKKMSLIAQNNTQNVKKYYDSIHSNAQRTGINAKELLGGYKTLTGGGYGAKEVNALILSEIFKLSAIIQASF